MKLKTFVTTISAFLVLAMSASAGKPSKTTSGPTLNSSCETCQLGENITFYGAGYKAGTTVLIEVSGPSSYTFSTEADRGGNIYVDFGSLLSYDPGSYSATAMTSSRKTLSPVAVTVFKVSDF
jgi:hypothetical protein